jgi:hypothetical protein
MEPTHSALAAWETFYVIVGSSGAALTGLQFVVIVLAADVGVLGGAPTTAAFATPTIVHFCAVLVVSAILSAPWPSLWSAAVVLGACGLIGVLYGLRVIWHARRQKDYVPVFEDWLFHAALPVLAYAMLLGAAIALPRHTATALFGIAGVSVLLLLVGIHNAWDAATWMAARKMAGRERGNEHSVPPDSGSESSTGRRARSGSRNGR